MSLSVKVLYGTETGNAEMVADDIVDALASQVSIEAQDMSKVDVSQLSSEHFYLLVCSTYGDGELPHSAQPLYAALEAQQPQLSNLRFASFGLGDSFYATYNHGSELIAERFSALGAQQVGAMGRHDASSGLLPSDVAVQWAHQVLDGLPL
jgi:MioC protein